MAEEENTTAVPEVSNVCKFTRAAFAVDEVRSSTESVATLIAGVVTVATAVVYLFRR